MQRAEFVARAFKYHAPTRTANLILDIVREDGQVVEAELRFAGNRPRYVQQVMIDGQTFGFDVLIDRQGDAKVMHDAVSRQEKRETFSSVDSVYRQAYCSLWRHFGALAHRKRGRSFDDCVKLMASYTRTFKILDAAADFAVQQFNLHQN